MLKGLSDENIKAPTTSYYSLSPQLCYLVNTASVKYKGSYLRQDKIMCNQGKIIKITLYTRELKTLL